MLLSRTGWLSALVVAGVLLSGGTAWAQKSGEKAEEKKTEKKAENPAEKTEAEKTAELVERLALAAELTAFGRGELADTTGLKDLKSPEALVAAGGILLRAHKQTGGKVKPSDASVTDEEGKTIPDEGAAPSLADEAEALFDEARALPSKDKAALEAQIKLAQTVPERGAAGGPRVISRTVKTGKAHNLHIKFQPNSPATVAMRGTGKTQFEVVGNGGNVLWHSAGAWGIYTWHTGRGGVKDITVRVINKGGPPVAYTVTTN